MSTLLVVALSSKVKTKFSSIKNSYSTLCALQVTRLKLNTYYVKGVQF